MKILVLNGSPKKQNSDTMHITRAFLDGMNQQCANQITQIDVVDKKIEYCKGCFTCKRNGGDCVIDDDMKLILDEILSSDILLLSFPLYCYGFPAGLKALIDRTMPLSAMAMKKVNERYEHLAQKDFSKLKYIMICGCGFPNSKQNFEPAVLQFKYCFPSNHTIITIPESPMFNVQEANSVTKPKLELVKKAGAEYAKNFCISTELLQDICSPMIPEEVYAKMCNGEE